MSRPIKKWPDYALAALEGTLLDLKEIDRMARQIQGLAAKGENAMEIVVLAGDIRNRTLDAIHLLVQARTGDYER